MATVQQEGAPVTEPGPPAKEPDSVDVMKVRVYDLMIARQSYETHIRSIDVEVERLRKLISSGMGLPVAP